MRIYKLSNDFTPRHEGLLFGIETEFDEPQDVEVEVVDVATNEVVATQLLHEVTYAEVNIAPYVAPALAMAVRTMIQPSLNVRTGQAGLSISSSLHADSSTTAAINALHKSLRLRRQSLLKRLSNYLKEHASDFPSYDASYDVMQKWTINGGYVQSY